MQNNTDFQNNVRRVSFSLAADGIDERPEGYKFMLTDASDTAILRTSEIFGTVLDGSDSGGGNGGRGGDRRQR
ncbi:MAG: hypothetical protein KF849_15400 [Rhizobiaceae bacterium]|nr:hypothetical protein [Rhizobiaceae bacterium]